MSANTCSTCTILTAKIADAEREGNDAKARVMRSLLMSHMKDKHQITVIAGPDNNLWPGREVRVTG